jgi:DNA polymerase III subunit delta'
MTWDEIIGHSKQIERLKRLITSRLISHALLFIGPDGIGKRLTAHIFAQNVLCDRKDNQACQVCPSCKAFIANNHPDFYELVPEGASLKIDQIRLLQKEAAFTPRLNQGRVFIIDEAEKMTTQAQNSLLKILEEPPPQVIFILIASNRQNLLETIFSRCQEIRFDLVALDAVRMALIQAGWPQQRAEIAAKISQGRVAAAFRFLETEGLAIRQFACEWLINLLELPASRVLDHAGKLTELSPEERSDFFYHIKWLLRDLLLSRLCNKQNYLCLAVNIDQQTVLERLGRYIQEQQVRMALSFFTTAEQSLRKNGNPRITFEFLVLSLRDLTIGRETSADSCGHPF